MEVQSRHNRAWTARWAVCVTIQCLAQNRWNILVPKSSSGSKVCWCAFGSVSLSGRVPFALSSDFAFSSSSLSALHEKTLHLCKVFENFSYELHFMILLLLKEIRNLDRLLGYIAADISGACNSLNGMHRCGCSCRSAASGNDIDFGWLRSRSRHGL